MKKILFLAVMLITANLAFAGTPKEINVQTNLHCESCKNKIEKELHTVNGVINSSANVKSKVVTIKYDPDKVNDTKIMSSITGLGYKAELVSDTKGNGKDMGISNECKTEKARKVNAKGGKESCCGKDKKK